MRELIMQRSAFNNEHLCSVEKYELTNDDSNNMFCEQFHEIKISYGHFDSYLDDWKKNYPLHEL